ncbi:MAG TPA: galactokinase [Demequinaceae bacterium]
MTAPEPCGAAASGAFAATFGHVPAVLASAPGRVNLIGEHTDYNDGLVLPFAIERRTWCALAPRSDGILRVTTTLNDAVVELGVDDLDPENLAGWSAYVFGVVWALREHGVDVASRGGLDIAVASDVPLGAGLSSSAALECAVAVAIDAEWELGLGVDVLARVCQRAENGAVGAPTGIMDQTASLLGQAGHGVLLDCRDNHSEIVPLCFAENGLDVMVVDTRVTHEHATGGYAERRASCDRGAAALGVSSLRDLSVADMVRAQAVLDDETFRRVRHVVTENDRVLAAATTLENDGPRAIGPLLLASHASMRDDFEISVPELDRAVEVAMEAGAIGARMTGGGFGGSAIALVPREKFELAEATVLSAFEASGFREAHIFTVVPSDGARRETL